MNPAVAHFVANEHVESTRRFFLRKLMVTGLSTAAIPAWAANEDRLKQAIAELGDYLTKSENFRNVERHRPLPYKLPKGKRLELGLERETWKCDVIADPESNSKLANPLSRESGNALDFEQLTKIAAEKSARFLKVMTCNNIDEPLGMGLWEGVPLREVIWLAKPERNVRRVFYRGYHNDDEKQIFQSSLSIGRVLEDPPGEMPVILCTKLNGNWLTGERGGPVRMIVPDAYGFKSVKWIQQIFLTNNHQANDTYAKANNDIDSKMKSFAIVLNWPDDGKTVPAGNPIPLAGVAQSGMSGVRKVQYWIKPKSEPLPDPQKDPNLTTGDWKDAEILPPPASWGEMLPGSEGKLPPTPLQFDTETGEPRRWPLRNTIAHWAVLAPGIRKPGEYEIRFRSIDENGAAQPMPRPFLKSGGNEIQVVALTVE
ncbi:MAG: molybdopterin-dependent oxidoreductase [Verrucomicrobiales bacterium]|nr:molybdopterin-dependent oxidoreductase [Verrucomicrobiales bacterium]